MKALLAALALACAPVALAGDVQVIVYQVEVSHKQMTALLAEGLPDAVLFTKVRGMVAAKSAAVRDTSSIRLKAGQRATIESIREIIYLTEQDPDYYRWNPKAMEELELMKKLPPEELRKKFARAILAYSFFPVLAAGERGPQFETRNVGLTLEADSDEDATAVRWALDFVSYERDTEIGRTLGLDGKPRIQRMPNFDSIRLTGDSSVAKGVAFAGTLTPVAADGSLARDRKIMVFVKADLLKQE